MHMERRRGNPAQARCLALKGGAEARMAGPLASGTGGAMLKGDGPRSGSATRWARLLVILLACGWTLAAMAQDIVAQGESLVRAGRYTEAFALLEPHEDRLAGDLKFDYLLARS